VDLCGHAVPTTPLLLRLQRNRAGGIGYGANLGGIAGFVGDIFIRDYVNRYLTRRVSEYGRSPSIIYLLRLAFRRPKIYCTAHPTGVVQGRRRDRIAKAAGDRTGVHLNKGQHVPFT